MQNIFAETNATVNISIVLQNLGLLDRAVTMWDNLSTTANQAKNANQPFIPPDKFWMHKNTFLRKNPDKNGKNAQNPFLNDN